MLQRQREGFSPRALEVGWSCQHLGCGPAQPIQTFDGRWADREQELGYRQGMRMGNWKTGWQKIFLQTLSLSQQGLQELSELQVDPILGTQHYF